MRAGAQIIETNTFGANRSDLARYNLGDKTIELNRAAVRLARAEARPDVYIAGSIGPCHCSTDANLPESASIDFSEVLREQLAALLEEGIDLVYFETFSETRDLAAAVALARTMTKLPIAASLIASRFGTSASGDDLAASAQRLIDGGADIIGLNCGYGIRAIEGAMEYVNHLGAPLSVMPNAGFPEQVGGRLRFGASEEYLANEALVLAQKGARIIGGCCGTTPAHIEAMARKLSEKKIVSKIRVRREILPALTDLGFKNGALLDSFSSVKVPIICEIDPPATLATGPNIDAIRCDGSRSDLANPALEAGAPVVRRIGWTNGIEVEQDVWLRFSGALAHDRLTDRGSLSPMNVAGVVSRAHQLEPEEVFSVATPDDVRGARGAAHLGRG